MCELEKRMKHFHLHDNNLTIFLEFFFRSFCSLDSACRIQFFCFVIVHHISVLSVSHSLLLSMCVCFFFKTKLLCSRYRDKMTPFVFFASWHRSERMIHSIRWLARLRARLANKVHLFHPPHYFHRRRFYF